MRPRATKWLVVVLALVGVAAAVAGWARSRRPAATRYETVPVERGRLVARVTATGTLSALVTVQVGSQVSGRLQEIRVDFNSAVHKGEVIARIDPQLFEAALEQTRANQVAAAANLARARVQAADAQRQLERARALRAQNLVAQADLDTAQANADGSKAQVAAAEGALEQARASQHQAQVNLDYTTIVSPINGTVISRNVDVGQTVAASLQAPTLFTIAEDLKKMQVDTSVAEADVGKLKAGMAATFTVDAYPTERFAGRVRQVRNAPQTVQNVVTYDAVIDVDNSDLKLKPGMTANVTFVYAEKDDVLEVANAALRFRPPPELMASLRAGRGAGGREHGAGAPGGGVRGATAPGGGGDRGAAAPGGAGDRGAAAPGGGGGAGGPGQRGGAAGGGAVGGGGWRGGGASGAGPGSDRGGGAGGGRAGGGGADAPDRRTVWVLRDGKPAPASVRIGVSDGTATEVVEGDVREGDALVTDVASGDGRPAGGPPGGFRRMF